MHQYRCLSLAMLLLIQLPLTACDMCSTYLGINPNDYQNSFGLVNRLRIFESSILSPVGSANSNFARLSHINPSEENGTNDPITYREEFRSFDLWANFFVNPRWQINLSTSFSDNYAKKSDSITNNISGIGDVLGIVKYQLFNTRQSMDSTIFVQRLLIGGGSKLPVGSFNKRGMEEEFDPHLQPGTGSFDFLLLTEYMFRYFKWGINTNIIYRFNLKNRNDFRFANRLNLNGALFYLQSLGKLKLMPSLGVAYESGKRDAYKGEKYLGSGGEAMFATTGLKLFFKNWSVGSTYFGRPMHEDLYDQSIQLKNKYRVISELNYYF